MGNTNKQYWLFQADPKKYDLLSEIIAKEGGSDYWYPKCHLKDMREGDGVVLWQSGPAAGVYGFARLTTGVRSIKGETRVYIGRMSLLPQPLYRRELLKSQMFRNLNVLRMPHSSNPYSVTPAQWSALQAAARKSSLNIFRSYGQQENRFTNGLVCLLSLSRHERVPLLNAVLACLSGMDSVGGIHSFRVLRGVDGTADAELQGKEWCIRIETKIASHALDDWQIQAHLASLQRARQSHKRLVLLTPDDGNSSYIRDLCKRHGKQVVHLEWTKVYECLENAARRHGRGMTHHLIEQYLDEIRQCILEQDYRGILLKVQFSSKTGLSSNTLISYLQNTASWHTPRRYEKLDGAGRKLLFYDPKKQAIVGEAEIREITKVRRQGFPWRNHFKPGTLCFFNAPGIGVAAIEQVAGLEAFGSARNGVWRLTAEQYRQLIPR